MSAQDQLKAISARATLLVDEQYTLLNEVLMPELARHGVVFVSPDSWSESQAAWISEYFVCEVEPVLSPLALDPARPFPKILNKSLNFAIVVEGEDGFGRNSGLAVVQAPRSLPRLIRLAGRARQPPIRVSGTIVEAFVSKLFAGMSVAAAISFA
jgi:polyphosphate kinase